MFSLVNMPKNFHQGHYDIDTSAEIELVLGQTEMEHTEGQTDVEIDIVIHIREAKYKVGRTLKNSQIHFAKFFTKEGAKWLIKYLHASTKSFYEKK